MARIDRITNAAPIVYEKGTDDQSVLPSTISAEQFPLHMPVWYLQTVKGVPGHSLVPASDLTSKYGDESFNLTGDFANHQTVGALTAQAEGNSCYVHRVTAGTYAKIQMYLDVLALDVPIYQRETDGSYSLDVAGERIPTGAVTPGYLAKWVAVADSVEYTHADIESGTLRLTGDAVKQVGTLVDPADPLNVSTLYPIYEVPASTPGEHGNWTGIRHYVPDALEVDEINANDAFIYEFALIKKNAKYSSTSLIRDINGGTTARVSFSKDAKDTFNNAPYYLPYQLEDNYENLTDPAYPQVLPEVGQVHVYDAFVAEILELVKVNEDTYTEVTINAGTMTPEMIVASAAKKHLFNIVDGTDINGVPYNTFVIDETASTNSVRLTAGNNIMLQGGEDRILDVAGYEAYVALDMAKYQDQDSEYHDKARFVDSVLWDTGFTVPTKLELCKYVSSRFDTFVVLSTFVDNPDDPRAMLTEAEELSVAIALRTAVRMYPGSDYFGTAAFAGMIVGGSGFIRGSDWRRRATLAFDLIAKFSKYMGAANGKMKPTARFSRAPGNLISNMTDVSLPWIPATRRIRKWDAGLNLPLHFDTRNLFWPALQTVAEDNTVLNSPLTALAVAYLNKAAHKAWRQFTGVDDMSDTELENALNEFITNDVFGRFDSRFIIEPQAFHTTADDARGYSWSLPINLYASDMKTVQTTWVRVYRKDAIEN